MSVLSVEFTFIAICTKQQSMRPGRGSAHLFTSSIEGHTGIGFDDQLIVHMSHDAAAAERFHGVTQDVPADALDAVTDDSCFASVPDGKSVPGTTVEQIEDGFFHPGGMNKYSIGQL